MEQDNHTREATSPLWMDSLAFWGIWKCLGGPQLSSKSSLHTWPHHTVVFISSLSKTWSVCPQSLKWRAFPPHIPHKSRQEMGWGSPLFPLHPHTSSYGKNHAPLRFLTPAKPVSVLVSATYQPSGYSQSSLAYFGVAFLLPFTCTGPFMNHKIANNKS